MRKTPTEQAGVKLPLEANKIVSLIRLAASNKTTNDIMVAPDPCNSNTTCTMHSLTLRATITQFDTIPYVEHELEEMDKKVRRVIEHFGIEKVIDEVVVQRLVAGSKNDLRKQIMRVYKRSHPNPIVVYTDAFEVGSFITRTPYRSRLPWTLGEQVLFRQENVLCRIIGRNVRAHYRYSRYWLGRHGGAASDFNDPNSFIARRMSMWT